MSMILGILFVGAGALVGGIAGWAIRGTQRWIATNPSVELPTQTVPTMSGAEVNSVLCRLQELTLHVANNVDEHATYVKEINTELKSAGESGDVVTIVAKLVNANEQMQEQLRVAETKLGEQAKKIEEHVSEARTDALTRLNNRRAFDDEWMRCQEEFAASGVPTTMMLIDVDFFKKFNDTHGHAAGDEVLRTVAKTLRRSVSSREMVCRYGGEEFAIIFPGSDVQTAIPAAERTRAAIANTAVLFEGRTLRVTASAGLAGFLPGQSGEDVVKRADSGLYASKGAGRNCGHWNDGTANHLIAPLNRTTIKVTEDALKNDLDAAAESRRKVMWSLSDRATLVNDLNRRLAEWKRGGAVVSILVISIDGFERFGNLDGENHRETVEGVTAQFLKATMRDMDHIATLGNGTFGLMLPSARLNDATAVGERIRKAIERCTVTTFAPKTRLTVSIGVTASGPEDDASEMLDRAEEAQSAARSDGGNRCVAIDSIRGRHPVAPTVLK